MYLPLKKSFCLLPVISLVFLVSSCLNSNNEERELYYVTMATITSNSLTPSFVTDYGVILNSTTNVSSDSSTFFENGDRVYLHFTFDDTTSNPENTYPITLLYYAKSTVSDFLTIEADSADLYDDSPLNDLISFWTSPNYFNVIVQAYEDFEDSKTIELVRYKESEPRTQVDTMPTIYFELRHNVHQTYPSFYYVHFFSFRMSPLVEEFPLAKSFNLSFNLKDLTRGIQSYEFKYIPVADTSQVSGVSENRFNLPILNRWPEGQHSFSYQ